MAVADPNRVTVPDDLMDADGESPSGVLPQVPSDGVPWVVASFDELRELPLDPHAAFLLSLIDGRFTVETIVDMCGLGAQRALRIFTRLLALGVIELRDERPLNESVPAPDGDL